MIKERDIEKAILEYLKFRQIFSWKVKSVGTFDPVSRQFRKNPQYMKGVSDILGIFKGKPLAIEVKGPKGRLRPEQVVFLERFAHEGGLAVVARSIEDVEDALTQFASGLIVPAPGSQPAKPTRTSSSR